MDYIRQYTALNPQELRQLGYKRRYKLESPEWDDSMVLLTKFVRERLAGRPCLLDFGCGRGNFVVDELGDVFEKKIGFDVLREAVEGNISMDEIAIGEAAELPFADHQFDIVISQWVLEHLADPGQALKETYRVLKPGGFFAFVTPNRSRPGRACRTPRLHGRSARGKSRSFLHVVQ